MTLALGGMTVEELKDKLSYYELKGWQLFEKKFGPLHPSIRIEGAIARAVAPFLKNAKTEYLMPWPLKDEDEQEGTPEDVFKLLQGVFKQGKTRKKRKKKSQKIPKKGKKIGKRIAERGLTDGKSQSR